MYGDADFDAIALYEAMNTQSIQRGLSWRRVADELWQQSHVLNERRREHAISATRLTGVAKRGDTTCPHALIIMRWLDRTPESFVPGAAQVIPGR